MSGSSVFQMKLSAKPNLNGNTEEDFQNVYELLGVALDAMFKARGAMMADILNGRNYQHTNESAMVDERKEVYELFRQMHWNVGTLRSAICDTLLEEELKND